MGAKSADFLAELLSNQQWSVESSLEAPQWILIVKIG